MIFICFLSGSFEVAGPGGHVVGDVVAGILHVGSPIQVN
jgi:hypothetical protein